MPAAAVIPAPIAYIKVVAVKKLVVGFLVGAAGPPRKRRDRCVPTAILGGASRGISFSCVCRPVFYCEKIRVFKAG